MKYTIALITVILFSFLLPEIDNQPDFYLGGIQVNEPDNKVWVQTLKKVGMNTVSVTVYAKQGDWDSDNLWFDEKNEGVVNEIRVAKEEGLAVVLILRVALDHAFERNKFLWHGMIMPKTNQLDSWFNKYSKFVKQWAEIAEDENIDVFVIGSEMNALTATSKIDSLTPLLEYYLNDIKQKQYKSKILKYNDTLASKHLWVRGFDNYKNSKAYLEAKIATNKKWATQVCYSDTGNINQINISREYLNKKWEELIKQTKELYSGNITYAANFDNYQEVGFWKDLNFIGINAYFPLRKYQPIISDTVKRTLFLNAWDSIFMEIDSFRIDNQLNNNPVIFTELGYTYRKNSTIEPWGAAGFSVLGDSSNSHLMVWDEQEVDQTERAMAVNTLYKTHLKKPDLLKGILYWKLTTKDYHIPIEPFVLHISEEQTDTLQEELIRFVNQTN